MMAELQAFQSTIGFTFEDELLLLRALTHRSYLNEVDEHPVTHNERLEFLGDAIIDFVVGEYLFHALPERREGELSSLRAALVRTAALARFAGTIGLGKQVLMGKGEESSGGRRRPALLADAFEALVAAMYLDQGLAATRQWVEQFIEPAVNDMLEQGRIGRDAKSYLQEVAQARLGITPIYRMLHAEGPDHDRTFTIAVMIGDEERGRGTGRSKQRAAQAAALAALESFGITKVL